ncbi:alpha-hydroxy acid oxidase [Limnohabitans sp. Jir72]|uniref:alpha-hydroxy acid oxidase n=1 Tax=Limnohabitans sp. Jir72 TaxID=1977909 RepID=UPI000D3CB3AC|nr:alpha-hydroxy-acid oxidizing enzyme [Limnohabitans sp. Jir72]
MGQHVTHTVNLQDHEDAARAVLDDGAWAYFSGGAADEITLGRNQQAWQQWALAPRVLQNLRGGHTHCQLLGQTWPFPLLVAPMALQRWAHPDGEAAMALAAASQQCGMVLSHQTSTDLHTVAQLTRQMALQGTERGPLWFQLYAHGDRGALAELVQQVEAAGYEALVLTVDAPVSGARDRERRHAAARPAHIHAVHAQPPAVASAIGLCQGLANSAPTWDDVTWLQSRTRLPILLKGITHPLDAKQAAQLALAGLIVSNHGGRTLDTMPATAELLPRVADAVQGEMTLLVDGGIRRGTDIFKALALGADAVLVGRPCVYGLAHAGAQGVAHVLRLLRDEFEIALALSGCATPEAITRHHLFGNTP